VLFQSKSKPRERFYLLPGQGGRNYARKQRRILGWTIAVALVFGMAMAGFMWWQSHPHP
jgi:hypothetical protein